MKKFSFLAMMLVVVLTAGFLVGCNSVSSENAIKKIESRFKVQLPSDAEVIYHYGEKNRIETNQYYTVFQLKEEPTEFLEKYNFNVSWYGTEKGYEEIVKESFEETFLDRLDMLVVDKDYYPDFSKEYLTAFFTRGVSGATNIYLPNEMRLVIWYYI